MIYVNTRDFDLDNATSLKRAQTIIIHPKSLKDKIILEDSNNTCVTYIQTLKLQPDAGHKRHINQYNEDMNKYITKQIVEGVGKNDFKNYDNDLVITYSLKQ